jgi:hypothetical protein
MAMNKISNEEIERAMQTLEQGQICGRDPRLTMIIILTDFFDGRTSEAPKRNIIEHDGHAWGPCLLDLDKITFIWPVVQIEMNVWRFAARIDGDTEKFIYKTKAKAEAARDALVAMWRG